MEIMAVTSVYSKYLEVSAKHAETSSFRIFYTKTIHPIQLKIESVIVRYIENTP